MYEEYFETLEKEFAIRNRKESSLHTYKFVIKLFLNWCEKKRRKL